MVDRSFFSGEADLDLSLDFASGLDFAFAMACADLSEPGDLLRPRLLLSLLLLPFSLPACPGRFTKTGTAPKALTCEAIACSCLLLWLNRSLSPESES